MKKAYIVANWKMHLTTGEASMYLHKLTKEIKSSRNIEVILAPSLVSLQPLSLQLDRRKFRLAAQNFYYQESGAFTGEVSISQLRGLVDYAIIGHSERRYVFNESDRDIRKKVASSIRSGITPILCIGETASERTFGETTTVLKDQLIGGLIDVSEEDIKKVIIAYEPVWAISTAKSAVRASAEDVANALEIIRGELRIMYGKKVAEEAIVLYGGSVIPQSVDDYLTIPTCDGLLVGSASLKLQDFVNIVEIAKRVKNA